MIEMTIVGLDMIETTIAGLDMIEATMTEDMKEATNLKIKMKAVYKMMAETVKIKKKAIASKMTAETPHHDITTVLEVILALADKEIVVSGETIELISETTFSTYLVKIGSRGQIVEELGLNLIEP